MSDALASCHEQLSWVDVQTHPPVSVLPRNVARVWSVVRAQKPLPLDRFPGKVDTKADGSVGGACARHDVCVPPVSCSRLVASVHAVDTMTTAATNDPTQAPAMLWIVVPPDDCCHLVVQQIHLMRSHQGNLALAGTYAHQSGHIVRSTSSMPALLTMCQTIFFRQEHGGLTTVVRRGRKKNKRHR